MSARRSSGKLAGSANPTKGIPGNASLSNWWLGLREPSQGARRLAARSRRGGRKRERVQRQDQQRVLGARHQVAGRSGSAAGEVPRGRWRYRAKRLERIMPDVDTEGESVIKGVAAS